MTETLVLNPASSLREVTYRISQFCLLLGIFLLPLSTYLANKILIAGMISVVISGDWKASWEIIKAQRTTWYILAFSFLVLVGVFYSGGGLKETLQGFTRNNKVLYFIFFLPLLTQQRFRDLLINTYVFTCVLSVVLIIGNIGDQPLINAIDSGFLIGFCSYIVLRKYLDSDKLQWFYGALFIFIAGYILFYNIERTGYVVFFGALVTLFWQYFRLRGLIIGVSVIIALVGSLYGLSPTFKQRIGMGVTEARSYLSENAKESRVLAVRWGLYNDWKLERAIRESMDIGIDNNLLPIELSIDLYQSYFGKQAMLTEQRWLFHPFEDIRGSSIGLRLGFLQYSWIGVKQHFWFGNGTGSFQDVYSKNGGPIIAGQYLPHPHNEYILIWFQYGIVGLIMYLLWQLTMWIESFKLPKNEQAILQGLLVCFALLGFCNASFTVNPSGDVLMLIGTVLLAAKINDTRRGAQWT